MLLFKSGSTNQTDDIYVRKNFTFEHNARTITAGGGDGMSTSTVLNFDSTHTWTSKATTAADTTTPRGAWFSNGVDALQFNDDPSLNMGANVDPIFDPIAAGTTPSKMMRFTLTRTAPFPLRTVTFDVNVTTAIVTAGPTFQGGARIRIRDNPPISNVTGDLPLPATWQEAMAAFSNANATSGTLRIQPLTPVTQTDGGLGDWRYEGEQAGSGTTAGNFFASVNINQRELIIANNNIAGTDQSSAFLGVAPGNMIFFTTGTNTIGLPTTTPGPATTGNSVLVRFLQEPAMTFTSGTVYNIALANPQLAMPTSGLSFVVNAADIGNLKFNEIARGDYVEV